MIISYYLLDFMFLISFLNYFLNIGDGHAKVQSILYQNRLLFSVMLFIFHGSVFVSMGEFSVDSLYLMFFLLTLMVLSLVDIREGLISDNINVFLFLTAIFYVVQLGISESLTENLGYAFGVMGVFTFIRFVSSVTYGQEIVGEGDFIPLSVLVLIFGIQYGIFLLLLSMILTVPFFIYSFVFDRENSNAIPFIPFLFVSVLLGFGCSEDMNAILDYIKISLF